MKIATQDQAFFPKNLTEKFQYLKDIGFNGFEIDGKVLVENLAAVKAAVEATGLPISSTCNGYTGWIGDTDEKRRQNGLKEITAILEALSEVGGTGIVVPAAWGMWSYPHFEAFPRTAEEDFAIVSDSLKVLDAVAGRTGTKIYLEPLNRYQDHMINVLADSRRYIDKNGFENVEVIADFYHMNMEESDSKIALEEQREKLGHVHLADNHRYAPGTGDIDFKGLFSVLKSNDYKGWLVYECLMRGENFDATYKESIDFIKQAWAEA
ncbi:sugar phosphate isomerase/epimerase family protein [Lactococcus garvieae]|uniref:sugar phosphate isomerase/epimerase family protein n=1 Tax=Lactococcus garvieae TaxID=1363 RepID=UPI0018D8B2FC|nr:sugar phosphate isomerase/epimerase family protein [Lactococcus garvieae]QPS71636.1 sugar phosphate isomerase/epimerase [Lactococcus garvieae]